MVQSLLDAGDDPERGLAKAILGEHTAIVDLLFGARKEANVNNVAALKAASKLGNLEMMKRLLDSGTYPLACGGECMKLACGMGMNSTCTASLATATHFMEKSGRLDMVKLLLKAGDDPEPGLTEAVLGNHIDIVRHFFASGARKKMRVNARKGEALKAATKSGNLDMMTCLLDSGASPFACHDECMVLACRMGMNSICILPLVKETHFMELLRSFGYGAVTSRRG